MRWRNARYVLERSESEKSFAKFIFQKSLSEWKMIDGKLSCDNFRRNIFLR